jgi:hypothetical protein
MIAKFYVTFDMTLMSLGVHLNSFSSSNGTKNHCMAVVHSDGLLEESTIRLIQPSLAGTRAEPGKKVKL